MPRTLTVADATGLPARVTALGWECASRTSSSGSVWVRVAGELDIATAPSLDRALRCALDNARLVVLDLRELTFTDSSGVHVIVHATRRARVMGRRMIVVRGRVQVDGVFAMAGASDQVEIGDLDTTEPPAQRSLQPAPERWASCT